MSHGGRDFEQALLAINELGYSVDAITLNPIHWVPQSRPSLFVIAKRDEGQQNRSFAIVTDTRSETSSKTCLTMTHSGGAESRRLFYEPNQREPRDGSLSQTITLWGERHA